MHKILVAIATVFLIFIVWIVYMADTNQETIFFDIVHSIPYGDKIGHVFLFGFLAFFMNLATRSKTFTLKISKIYAGSLFVIVFFTLEELSQYFFSSRTLDVGDYLASLLGVVIFSWLTKFTSAKHLTSQARVTP